MARIVCQVMHRPGRVTFLWSEGAASFEPYHLEGQELEAFYQAGRQSRQALGGCVSSSDPGAALELAQAGQRLYRSLFRLDAAEPRHVRAIQQWLYDLHGRNQVEIFEIQSDVPGRIPWNAVYDQAAEETALRSGDPAAFKPFWGFRFPLATGRRGNPLKTASVLDSPALLLAADPGLVERLPAHQKNLLADLAIAQDLPLIDAAAALRKKLHDQAPDILYLFAPVERGALILGGERITLVQLRDLLAGAESGNPDPVIFLQATGDPAGWEHWECFLGAAVNALSGTVTSEVPVSPALANVLGVEALVQFLQGNQRLGKVLQEIRAKQDLAGLVYSAFCPGHVKIAADAATKPDVPGPEPIPLPAFPYRPLAPFESEDRPLFTGREDDIVRCAGLLDEAGTRGLLLHGGGGVGKSSFLRAGLLPHLETEADGFLALRDRTPEGAPRAEKDYPVLAIRAGADLAGQLAEAVCAFCAQPFSYQDPLGQTVMVDLPSLVREAIQGATSTGITELPAHPPSSSEAIADPTNAPPRSSPAIPSPASLQPERLWRELRKDPDLFARLLDILTRRLPFELVIFVDQGEELLTQKGGEEGKERRRLALSTLAGLFRGPARCKVVLEIRTEYLGRFLEDCPPGQGIWRQYFLDKLNADQMLQALLLPTAAEPVPFCDEVPYQKYRFAYEDGLAKELVRDALKASKERKLSALAVLQAMGAFLYERARARNLTVIGKPDRKDLGPAEGALSRYVDGQIRDLRLPPGDARSLQGLFDKLATRHTDGTTTRALVPIQDLSKKWKNPADFERSVQRAADKGLVEVHLLLVDGREDLYLSLPQEGLAQVAGQWAEDRKRAAYGWEKIKDTLWIMIPLLFLAASITWVLTRRAAAQGEGPEDLVTENKKLEALTEVLQTERELSRWPIYTGAVARAEQALVTGNALGVRQLLPKDLDLRGFDWYYLWRQANQERHLLQGHLGTVNAVAVSPDGRTAATASDDGTVKLWNVKEGEIKATLKGHVGKVNAVAFSPDGKLIASAGADKTVRLWDAAAGQVKYAVVTKEMKALAGHTDAVTALAFGKEAAVLVSAGADKRIILWNVDKGKEGQVFKDHKEPVQGLAVSPDGKTLASLSGAGTISVFQLSPFKVVQTMQAPGRVFAQAFAPDGKTLASGGDELSAARNMGVVRFWDAGTGKETGNPLRPGPTLLGLAFIPQTKLLAVAGKDNVVRIWDPAAGEEKMRFLGHLGWINALAVSSDGQTLVTGSYDYTARIWDGPNAKAPDSIRAHPESATALAFAPDDRIVASGGNDGAVKLWDPASGQLLADLPGKGQVTGLAFTPKGDTLKLAAGFATDKNEGEIKLWEVTVDPKAGVKTKELPGLKHPTAIFGLAMSPDGKTLGFGSLDQAILWDGGTAKVKFKLNGHKGKVWSVAFTADSKQLLSAGQDQSIRTWDVATGEQAGKTLDGAHTAAINAIAVFQFPPRTNPPYGFVSAGDDQVVRIWFAGGDKPHGSLRPHARPVGQIAVSSASDFFVTAGADGAVKLFDIRVVKSASGVALANSFGEERLTFHAAPAVRAVAISNDRLTIAAGGSDGMIRFWRAAKE